MYLASIVLQSLVLGTQILMIAVALYLVSAASRIVHLAIGAIGASAAYALYWSITLGWPLWTGIAFALLVAVVLGLISAELLEPFAVRQEPLLGLLVSFALGIIIESLIAIFFGTDGKSLQTGILPVVQIGGAGIDLPGIITICIGVFAALFSWLVVHFTGVGRLLRSVAENSALTTSLGVDNKLIRHVAYVTAAVVAAIITGLAGWHTALVPHMGFQLVIAAFIALLMGGISDLRGTVIASYATAVIPGLIIGYASGFSENWRLVFVFLIAAVVLALRPHGIFSRKTREA
ncbi:branched-chain amino acid ABC transporter permease [Candidatus Parcubacteria bacterium]|nr:MAG: branched-chain amino acid ABC transporter permease [Candidatus Parcubacteria bacterium]